MQAIEHAAGDQGAVRRSGGAQVDHVADGDRATVALERLDHEVPVAGDVDGGALDVVGAEVDPNAAAERGRPATPGVEQAGCARLHELAVADVEPVQERDEQVDPVDRRAEPVDVVGEAGDLGQVVAVIGGARGQVTLRPMPTTTTARSCGPGAR